MEEKLREHIQRVITLTDDEFAFVLAHLEIKRFDKHQFLIQEGESVRYAYFVVSGLLKLVHTDALGKQHILSFAMEDGWECDFEAYFAHSKATSSLVCVESSVVFCLSVDAYQALCISLPKMQLFFLFVATYSCIAVQRRLLSMLTSPAKERYEQLLKQYPLLVQRVPKTLLAAYLGVSRETLSRLSD